MSELIENTVLLVENFNDEIRSDLSSKGFDDSGEAANSLRITKTKKSVTSHGVFYIEYLDRGSAPWRNPNQYKKLGFILSADVSDWAFRKATDISPYAIAHTIAHKGNSIYRNPSSGLTILRKIDDLKVKIKNNAPFWAKADILTELHKINQKIQ